MALLSYIFSRRIDAPLLVAGYGAASCVRQDRHRPKPPYLVTRVAGCAMSRRSRLRQL